jgi:hypothetical protein
MQYIVLFILLTRNIYWRYAFSQKVDNSGQKLNDLLICLTNQTYCEIDYLFSQAIRFELGVLLAAKGGRMTAINLEEARINLEGQWLSAEDLTNMIQEKMQAGDMKFSNLATALEELNNALENSTTLDIKLVLTKEEYEKLKAAGGDDDRKSVLKALTAFIGGSTAGLKRLAIKCPKCKASIEITTDERPLDVECSKCGTGGRLTAQNKWAKLD